MSVATTLAGAPNGDINALYESQKPLPFNAFSTVFITGLVVPFHQSASESPQPIQLQMHRVTPPLLEVTPYVTRDDREFFGDEHQDILCLPGRRPPDRLPSQLPEPGDITVSLSLGTLLGWGSSSQAFSTTLTGDSIHLTSRVPPLVVKVIRPTRIALLVREASIYEELESIQGIAIPRCYGLFKGRLPDNFSLIEKRPRYWKDELYSDESDSEIVPLPKGAPDDYVFEGRPPVQEYIRRSYYDADEIYILVLEQLGKPLDEDNPPDLPRKQLKAELTGITEDIARLCVEQGDVRGSNIVEAGEPKWRKFCPRHQCTHGYRYIDFSHGFKRELTYEKLLTEYHDVLRFVGE